MIFFNFRLLSRIIYSIVLISICIFSGTVGYIVIEGYTTVDAFYMTIITISTVGFSEVQTLSENGRIFTTLLIIFSFGTFAYAITSVSSYIFGGEYKRLRKKIKDKRKINIMKDHVIICGYGRVGKQVAEDFISTKQSFVIIELEKSRVEYLEDDPRYNFILGDATADVNLINANVEHAKAVITCMPSDANNLYVVLAAKEINPKVKIIARASKLETHNKLKFAGADNVIMPDSVGGSHMASLVVRPDVIEFMDEIRLNDERTPNIVGIAYEDLPGKFKGKEISNLDNAFNTGCNIVGLKDKDGEYIVNPEKQMMLEEGCKVFVLGNNEQLLELKEHLNFR